MSQPIELNAICRYIGPGDGKMAQHKVIELTKEHVITWSRYRADDIDTLGWSWMGPHDQFIQQFRPCLSNEI